MQYAITVRQDNRFIAEVSVVDADAAARVAHKVLTEYDGALALNVRPVPTLPPGVAMNWAEAYGLIKRSFQGAEPEIDPIDEQITRWHARLDRAVKERNAPNLGYENFRAFRWVTSHSWSGEEREVREAGRALLRRCLECVYANSGISDDTKEQNIRTKLDRYIPTRTRERIETLVDHTIPTRPEEANHAQSSTE